MANFTLSFPIKGINKLTSTDKQPPLTSPDMLNVRPLGIFEKRVRGGQRPGMGKWGNGDKIGGSEQPVVAMCTVTTVE